MVPTLDHRIQQSRNWSRLIPEEEWQIYREVIDEARRRNVELALGGAFAVATYTGFWRNTKDIDLYIFPHDRDTMVDVLRACGLRDYYEQQPYDRRWIYRGCKEGTIVDVIWEMANHHSSVDELWMSGPEIEVRGERLRVIPAEAMVFDKVYIMQRERCDWPDVLNLLYWTSTYLDWNKVLDRLGPDAPLLGAVLTVFRWMSPGRARLVPSWVWGELGLPGLPEDSDEEPEIDPRRVSLLDTRPWYGPDRARLQPAA